jgi:hypothetical protein
MVNNKFSCFVNSLSDTLALLEADHSGFLLNPAIIALESRQKELGETPGNTNSLIDEFISHLKERRFKKAYHVIAELEAFLLEE